MADPGVRASPLGAIAREFGPDVVLASVAVSVLVTAASWPARAALFPTLIASVLLALIAGRVVWTLTPRLLALRRAGSTATDRNPEPGAAGGATAGEDGGSPASGGDIGLDLTGRSREVVAFAATFAGYAIALIVLGFVTGTAVATALTVRYATRGSWRAAIVTALALAVLVWGLQEVFGLDFRTGLLF